MPSRWQGKSILVLDEVLVPSPYTPEVGGCISLVLSDEVLVPSPYTPEVGREISVSAPLYVTPPPIISPPPQAATILPGIVGQASLTRVQKVLTAERKRLGL